MTLLESNDQNEFMYFRHHWAAWLESYAHLNRELTGVPILPELRRVQVEGHNGIAIQVGRRKELQDRARFIYGAVEVPPSAWQASAILEPASLFEYLAWGPDPRFAHSEVPERLLLRIHAESVNAFRALVENFIRSLYEANTPGLRQTRISAALLETRLDWVDGLFFVDWVPSIQFSFWLNTLKRSDKKILLAQPDEVLDGVKKPDYIRFYCPYEPKTALDQQDSPSGVWMPFLPESDHNRTLPYIESLAEILRKGKDGALFLVEPAPGNGCHVIRVSSAFTPIFHLAELDLQQQPRQVTQWDPVPPLLRQAFTVQFGLRIDPDRHARLDQAKWSLETAERRVVSDLERLDLDQRRLQVELRRLHQSKNQVQAELLHQASPIHINSSVLGEEPKRIYVYFESHSRAPLLSRKWAALQEALLNASLAQLRNLRHIWCQFTFTDPRQDSQDEVQVAFHLISTASPQDQPDGSIPAGLEEADLVFEQDLYWRKLGYSLYAPGGYYLFPPLRPLPLLTNTSTPEPEAISNERCPVFNNLITKAIFQPEDHATSNPSDGSSSPASQVSDSICLIYQDPYCGALVPIYLQAANWLPLDERAFALINQAGLTQVSSIWLESVTHQINHQITRRLQESTQENLHAEVNEISQKMQDLLKEALQRREQELDNYRIELEVLLDQKRASATTQLEQMRTHWEDVKAEVLRIEEELFGSAVSRQLGLAGGKTGAARKLLKQLRRRSSEIELLIQQGIESWEEFVRQVVAVSTAVEIDLEQEAQNTEARIHEIDERLNTLTVNLAIKMRPRVDQLRGLFEQLASQMGERTGRLQMALNLLDQMDHNLKGSVPAVIPPPVSPVAETETGLQDKLNHLEYEFSRMQNDAHSRESELRRQIQDQQRQMDDLVSQIERSRQLKERQHNFQQERLRSEQRHAQELQERIQELRGAQGRIAELEEQVKMARQQAEDEIAQINLKAETQIKQAQEHLSEIRGLEETLHLYDFSIQNLDNPNAVHHLQELNRAVSSLHYAEHQLGPAHQSGMSLIRKQLVKEMEALFPGLAEIPVEPGVTLFDPTIHVGIAIESDPQKCDHVVLRVLQSGFTWRGRVKWPIQVVVNNYSQPKGENDDNGLNHE